MLDDPKEFDKLTDVQKQALINWIEQHLKPYQIKSFNPYLSSYILKHYFQKNGGFYVTNGAFKGAVQHVGLQPKDETSRNWVFRIGNRAIRNKRYAS